MTRVALLYVDNFQQSRSQRLGSLGLGYIASYLQQECADLEVTIAITPQEILAFEPDIIGISAYTETLPKAIEYAQWLKQKSRVPLVLGGPHIASNPLDLAPCFDIGVVGEGEETFLALVQQLRGNALTPNHLQAIAGLTFWQDGQRQHTGRCPPIREMDRLAHPNRRMMFQSLQQHFGAFQPVLHLHTARGCPYRCTFCSAPLVNPDWRFHSPEWVVTELETIAQQYPDCRELTISDDLFTLHKRRLEALVQAIREAGLHKRFFFFCSARSNTLTPDMCRLLLDMNVLVVAFGFESASNHLIKELKGVGVSQNDYQRVLDLCAHHGIYAHGNFIIGSQHETRQDLRQTYQFIQNNRDRMASMYTTHMTPFPGTAVWDQALAAGLIQPEQMALQTLNLEYEGAHSTFLNTHYSRPFYQQAWQQFKQLETHINDRYYAEEGLLKDMAWQERYDIPEQVLTMAAHLKWASLLVITSTQISWPDGVDCQIEQTSWEQRPADLRGYSAVLLNHTLEETRQPAAILAALAAYPQLPVMTLTWNIGNYYELILLLLGKWEEGVYSLRQRHIYRYYSLHSLNQLMQRYQKTLQARYPNRFRAMPNYEALQVLGTLPQPVDPDVFSYLAVWQ